MRRGFLLDSKPKPAHVPREQTTQEEPKAPTSSKSAETAASKPEPPKSKPQAKTKGAATLSSVAGSSSESPSGMPTKLTNPFSKLNISQPTPQFMMTEEQQKLAKTEKMDAYSLMNSQRFASLPPNKLPEATLKTCLTRWQIYARTLQLRTMPLGKTLPLRPFPRCPE